MPAERNRTAMLRFYDAVNAHDIDAVGALLAEDDVAHCIPEELGQTREAYLTFMQMAFEAFPDLRYEALEVVAEGDLVATRYRNTGTHEGEFLGIPASGRPLDIEGSDVCRFDADGRIVAHWAYADNLALLQQLGAIPEDPAG